MTFKSPAQRKKFFAKFPQTVRPISTDEMLQLQNRYAYAHDYNNYNQLPFKDYVEWYDSVSKFWNPNNPPYAKQAGMKKYTKNGKKIRIR